MSLAVYRLATGLMAPAISAYLHRRRRQGKEDAERFRERLGWPGRERPAGPLVWLHAASVGEAVSVLPLIDRLLQRRHDLAVLLTTGSVTSAAVAGKRLPPRAIHQYVPVDRRDAVRRFLDHWHPNVGIWVESELWPNLVLEAHQRGMPMAMINARMSAASFRNWRRLPFAIRPLLAAFDLCAAQSETDAKRFAELGARNVVFAGNLKQAAAPLEVDAEALSCVLAAIGDRPRWLAASTHAGEDTMIAEVHRQLAPAHPGLLSIVVPRHAVRGDDIAGEMSAAGLKVARRSRGELPEASTDIFLGDTMGEMGLYYRLAPIAFMGGSLVEHGGQNPLEAARLDCALLAGPHMYNFADAVADLAAAGGLRTVADTAALAHEVGRLLADPGVVDQRARAARQVAADGGHVIDDLLEHLRPLLPAEAA